MVVALVCEFDGVGSLLHVIDTRHAIYPKRKRDMKYGTGLSWVVFWTCLMDLYDGDVNLQVENTKNSTADIVPSFSTNRSKSSQRMLF
jgi:hypothetical protein